MEILLRLEYVKKRQRAKHDVYELTETGRRGTPIMLGAQALRRKMASPLCIIIIIIIIFHYVCPIHRVCDQATRSICWPVWQFFKNAF